MIFEQDRLMESLILSRGQYVTDINDPSIVSYLKDTDATPLFDLIEDKYYYGSAEFSEIPADTLCLYCETEIESTANYSIKTNQFVIPIPKILGRLITIDEDTKIPIEVILTNLINNSEL